MLRGLSRSSWPAAGPPAPVRVVHLGLGAFHRAHQAWYTHRANLAGAEQAGIAAFTGRRPDAGRRLTEQNGLYGLLVRGADGDEVEVVTSISAAHDGSRVDEMVRYLADPQVGVVTLTVTEAGYRRAAGGGLDVADDAVAADIETMRSGGDALHTAPARLLAALRARRAADAGPIAVVPCDNLPANGPTVHAVMRELADLVDPALASYLDESVRFVSTTVDRITPATIDADKHAVGERLGLVDEAAVVTEPFTEWVLAGEFPAGRPGWEAAGARFVADVEPFEQRKLYLLNGAHSMLAYAGLAHGHATMAEAVAEDGLREHVERWWAEASGQLPLPAAELATYTEALLSRFANPALRHLLQQVAMDGSQKLPIRVLPVVRAERAAGRLPTGAVFAVGAWLAHLRGAGGDVVDPLASQLAADAGGATDAAARGVLGVIASDLADDTDLVAAVADACERVEAR